jgi:hypothetical protein
VANFKVLAGIAMIAVIVVVVALSNAPARPTAVSVAAVDAVDAVVTARPHCLAVSNPIPNCEAVMSGTMAPAPYADNSKLDYGRPGSGTSNTRFLDPPSIKSEDPAEYPRGVRPAPTIWKEAPPSSDEGRDIIMGCDESSRDRRTNLRPARCD